MNIIQSDWASATWNVSELKATVGILRHLITAPATTPVEIGEWRKVANDLISLADRVEQLWEIVWDQWRSTRSGEGEV